MSQKMRRSTADGLCVEADPDCDSPMPRICHDCAAEVWTTVEDQEDVVEAMRLDAVDKTTETLNGALANEVHVDKIKGSDDDTTGRGGRVPPS